MLKEITQFYSENLKSPVFVPNEGKHPVSEAFPHQNMSKTLEKKHQKCKQICNKLFRNYTTWVSGACITSASVTSSLSALKPHFGQTLVTTTAHRSINICPPHSPTPSASLADYACLTAWTTWFVHTNRAEIAKTAQIPPKKQSPIAATQSLFAIMTSKLWEGGFLTVMMFGGQLTRGILGFIRCCGMLTNQGHSWLEPQASAVIFLLS